MFKDGWVLVYKDTFTPAKVGEELKTSRDENVILDGGRPPHKSSSQGFIWVRPTETNGPDAGYTGTIEFYASVCGLRWTNRLFFWKEEIDTSGDYINMAAEYEPYSGTALFEDQTNGLKGLINAQYPWPDGRFDADLFKGHVMKCYRSGEYVDYKKGG